MGVAFKCLNPPAHALEKGIDPIRRPIVSLLDHGKEKFPVAAVTASSEPLGWVGIATEIRSHPAGELPPYTSSQTEITIALRRTPGAIVDRAAGGMQQRTPVNAGTIWISPTGVQEEATRISAPLTEIAHIYLSHDRFASLNSDLGVNFGEGSLDYVADARDDLIRQMGASLVSELRDPTSTGKLLAESLGLSLAARIIQRHSTAARSLKASSALSDWGTDDPRLRRVVDYMMANLEEPIGLDDLASVACLSPFHFARTFRDKAGTPPHRFLSVLRLEHAKTLLATSNRTLCDIALACQFSSQTNFTRAFRQATGVTPSEFRKLA